MRTPFLLLLLACVGASLNWRKVNKLRRMLAKVEADIDVDSLLALRQKLDRHLKAPKLDLQQQARLAQRLKMLKRNNATRSKSIEYINEKSGISTLLYQGDMILTEKQADELIEGNDGDRDRRQADLHVSKWDKVLYYSFHSSADERMKTATQRGTKLWHDNTCIDMVEDETAKERVEVYFGVGCNSYVGNLHKKQQLSLGQNCDQYWIAAHEFGHALGMHHTHSRSDRDKYVTINIENVKKGTENNWFKENTENYGVPYDFGSTMHYDGYAGAEDPLQPVIVPHEQYENYLTTMGSPFMSFYDILLMNKHYGCLGSMKTVNAEAVAYRRLSKRYLREHCNYLL